MPTIAIDFGTANTRVAVWQNGSIRILENENANRSTPGYVAFGENERFFGDAAKNQVAMNATNTVYDLKRFIGRRSEDSWLQEDATNVFFKIDTTTTYPLIEVTAYGQVERFHIEELVAMMLVRSKQMAERILKEPVADAVITVPTFFSSIQRQTTLDAAKIAGFDVVHLINETTAAALAYGFQSRVQGKQKVLVFHFGAGTLNVAVVEIQNGAKFKVLAVGGDSSLGAVNFDLQLAGHFIEEFHRTTGINISENPRAMLRLRRACEKLRIVLSTNLEATIEVNELSDGIDFYSTMQRSKFEDICGQACTVAFDWVQEVLREAGLKASSVDEVLLAGGLTRMPKLQSHLETLFGKAKINHTINVEQIAINGATIMAAMQTEVHTLQLQQISIREVTGIPFFFRPNGLTCVLKVFDANTRLPCNCCFDCPVNDQSTQSIMSFEGCQGAAFYQQFLYQHMPEIEAHSVRCIFDVDANGVLEFDAEFLTTAGAVAVRISPADERLKSEDFESIINVRDQMAEKDRVSQAHRTARIEFEEHILTTRKLLSNRSETQHLTSENVDRLRMMCSAALEWLDANQHEGIETFRARLETLRNDFDAIFNMPRDPRDDQILPAGGGDQL